QHSPPPPSRSRPPPAVAREPSTAPLPAFQGHPGRRACPTPSSRRSTPRGGTSDGSEQTQFVHIVKAGRILRAVIIEGNEHPNKQKVDISLREMNRSDRKSVV